MKVKSIEIWRILFALSIMLCHACLLPWNQSLDGRQLFHVNSLGVEFYFVLSGYLMAKSAKRGSENYGSDTVSFLYRKLKAIYPTFLFAAVFEIVIATTLRSSITWNIKSCVWDVLFLRLFSLSGNEELLVGASWYLFALFPAMAVIYPFLRAKRDIFLNIIAPLSALFIFGYFSHNYGHINFALHTTEKGVSLGLLRAISELCLGCFCYALCEKLRERGRTRPSASIAFTIIEILSLSSIFAFAVLGIRSHTDFICLLLISLGIVSAFSGKSYINFFMSRVPDSVISFISKYSLALYLNHYVWLRTFQDWKLPVSFWLHLIMYVCLSLTTSLVCVFTVDLLKAWINSIKKNHAKVSG